MPRLKRIFPFAERFCACCHNKTVREGPRRLKKKVIAEGMRKTLRMIKRCFYREEGSRQFNIREGVHKIGILNKIGIRCENSGSYDY